MNFEKGALNKIYSFLSTRKHGCIICMIYDQVVVKKYLYLTHNVKFNMKNEEIGIIDQHMNATCQM